MRQWTRYLPSSMRPMLRKPFGKLTYQEALADEVGKADLRVAVGDRVSLNLYNGGVAPHLAIVDFRTRRGPCTEEMKEAIKRVGKTVLRARNPPGTITQELWETVQLAYQMDNVRIEVDGEEDLAVIPCVILAPEDVQVVVAYGLWEQGGVGVIRVNDDARRITKGILSKMSFEE